MQQQTPTGPLADLAKTPASRPLGAEVDLTQVLDREHVAARTGGPRRLAPTRDQSRRRHPAVRQEPAKTHDLPASPPRQTPKTHARARHHLAQKPGPLFSSRSSPNVPSA